MKKLLVIFLFVPLLLNAQEGEYGVFQSVMLTPKTDMVQEFETRVAAHNKKYHAEEPYGARVYSIQSGPNVGKYIWNLGPLPWSAMDGRPSQGGHDDDWSGKVVPTLTTDAYARYWKQDLNLSHFPGDFTLKRLLVWYIDIKRFNEAKMNELMKKIREVYVAKLPQETYGVYINELSSTSDGKDMAIVWFFEKSAWMGIDQQFAKLYDEVHGAGSFNTFLKDFEGATNGVEAELWAFRGDLSGMDANVSLPE